MKFLLIGQGLAGTTLGWRLERAGHDVFFVDAPEQTAASSVAAGIINPITGRRFVKSWRIDELLPAARTLYKDCEAALGGRFYFDSPLVRTLYNRGDLNDWQARSADPGYAEYMDETPATGRLTELTAPVFAYAGVRHAARVDVRGLTAAYRTHLLKNGRLFAEAFDYAQLPELLGADAGAGQGDEKSRVGAAGPYDHVVSCEGWRARFNPYFNYLPHGGNKGEVLIVRTAAPPLELMFKHRVFLVPLTDGTYWVGATSENRFDDDQPTVANGNFLRDRLAEVLTGTDYEVVDHRAAVRPTVRDRRMFLGTHPDHPRLHIFNGLGTKGASLAALGSRWLADFLLHGSTLPDEVDIARFEKASR